MHNATVSASYELPFGKRKAFLNGGGIVDVFVGGWIINGIGSLRTGFPTDIRTNVLPPVFNTYNVASCVPGVAKKLPNAGVNGYFNPAAFTVPVTVVGAQGQNVQTFGNCGHFPTTGPGYRNLDSSIFKDFHYSERIYAQFRAEFFDTTNTPILHAAGSQRSDLDLSGRSRSCLQCEQRELRQALQRFSDWPADSIFVEDLLLRRLSSGKHQPEKL